MIARVPAGEDGWWCAQARVSRRGRFADGARRPAKGSAVGAAAGQDWLARRSPLQRRRFGRRQCADNTNFLVLPNAVVRLLFFALCLCC